MCPVPYRRCRLRPTDQGSQWRASASVTDEHPNARFPPPFEPREGWGSLPGAPARLGYSYFEQNSAEENGQLFEAPIMKIESVRIRNYKSFDETPEIEFSSGFNVLAGQNSSGKTALLECLTLNFEPNSHRSLKKLPARDTIPDPSSTVDVSLTLDREEILSILAGRPDQLYIPLPNYPTGFTNDIIYTDNNPDSIARLVKKVFSLPKLTFRSRRVSTIGQAPRWILPSFPSYGLYDGQRSNQNGVFGTFHIARDRTSSANGAEITGLEREFAIPLLDSAIARIFRFSAERLNVGECPFGTRTDLLANAANLPEVLNSLQQNPHLFTEFNALVHRNLPQVQQITVRPNPRAQQSVQIVVWPHHPQTAREDLAIPLDQCGTGIGQVLAILYLAVRASFPRIILIDEPQSFLHPGAVRKLVEVLGHYRQHQFIISTHSPTVITAADPENILVSQLDAGVSKINRIHSRDNRALQLLLTDIGVRFSDLFGADRILWLEGATEEVCFPIILQKIAKKPLAGTMMAGLRRTGDLERKDAARIFEIYDSLSTSGTLVPPVVGFILDRECRGADEREAIRKRSRGLATFLPRRMFENYLLNSNAISDVVSKIKGFDLKSSTPDKVATTLAAKRSERKYYCSPDPSLRTPDNWVREINGAKVLLDIFEELSGKTVEYDKVDHGLELTNWIAENSPDELAEVATVLSSLLP